MRTIEVFAGETIYRASEQAAALAAQHNEPVRFEFNGVDLTVKPGESGDVAVRAFSESCNQRSRERDLLRAGMLRSVLRLVNREYVHGVAATLKEVFPGEGEVINLAVKDFE